MTEAFPRSASRTPASLLAGLGPPRLEPRLGPNFLPLGLLPRPRSAQPRGAGPEDPEERALVQVVVEEEPLGPEGGLEVLDPLDPGRGEEVEVTVPLPRPPLHRLGVHEVIRIVATIGAVEAADVGGLVLAVGEDDAAGDHPALEPGHPELRVPLLEAGDAAEEALAEGRPPLPVPRRLVIETAELEESR